MKARPARPWHDFLPLACLIAVGMGLTFVPLTVQSTKSVPASEAGLASRTFNISRQIGASLGLAVLQRPLLREPRVSRPRATASAATSLTSGFEVAFGVGALTIASAAGALLLLARGRTRAERMEAESVTQP